MHSNKQTPMRAVIWSFVEKFSAQLVGFALGVILARLLDPHDYGVVGLISIFIALSSVFVDAGFANALICKQDRTDADLSTALYFNAGVGVFFYILLWVCAPLIASFFNEPILVKLVRIVGLNIVFNSLCIVQIAILTAQFKIRSQAYINVFCQVIAGLIAVFLAYSGFGVYALALQSVISAALKTICYWANAKWKPTKAFSKVSFKYLWGFGSKLLFASLLGTTFSKIFSVLIGKFIGVTDLGYYSKAGNLNEHVNSTTRGIVQRVSLPVLSKYQNDPSALVNHYNRILCTMVLFIAPLSSFLCVAANDIIVLLWTEKWLNTVLLFQLLVISSIWAPIGQLTLSLFQVVNRTDIILKLEIPKKITYALLIFLGFLLGVEGLCAVQILISASEACFNMYATKSILPISRVAQLWNSSKYLLYSMTLPFFACYFIHTDSLVINIILKLLAFVVLYVIVLLIVKDQVFLSCLKTFIISLKKKSI